MAKGVDAEGTGVEGCGVKRLPVGNEAASLAFVLPVAVEAFPKGVSAAETMSATCAALELVGAGDDVRLEGPADATFVPMLLPNVGVDT